MIITNTSSSSVGEQDDTNRISCGSRALCFCKKLISDRCQQVFNLISCGFVSCICDCLANRRALRQVTPMANGMGENSSRGYGQNRLESAAEADKNLSARFNDPEDRQNLSGSEEDAPPSTTIIRVSPKVPSALEEVWNQWITESQRKLDRTLSDEDGFTYFTRGITLGNKSFFLVARPEESFLDEWLSQALIEEGLLIDLGNRLDDLISQHYPPQNASTKSGRFGVDVYQFQSNDGMIRSLIRWKSSYLSCQKPITLAWFHDMIVKVYHHKKIPFVYCDDKMHISAMFVIGYAMYQLSLWDKLKETTPLDLLKELLISMRVLLRQADAVDYEKGEFLFHYAQFLLERPSIMGLEESENSEAPSSTDSSVSVQPFHALDALLNQTSVDNTSSLQ